MGFSGSIEVPETKTASSALLRRKSGRFLDLKILYAFASFTLSKGVEPISEWKSPDSVQMSLVSYFFKLSMVLRNVHTVLTEDYQVGCFG